MRPLTLFPLPAFSDNYIWILHNETHAWVVDPGVATPVLDYLALHEIQLEGIIITHHHGDHTGGVDELRLVTGASAYGPAHEFLPKATSLLRDGDRIEMLGISFDVIGVPGHTLEHVAFFSQDIPGAPILFCGDTLFSGGCGRLFEGSPAQMLASLDMLAQLPTQTRVCCAHEYTLSNLRFAQTVEPANEYLIIYKRLCEALRANGLPTLPSRLGVELRVNPFLRCRMESVKASVAEKIKGLIDDELVFSALREWKNDFS